MKRARTFRAANAQMRQLGFGFIDLLLHVRYEPARDGDPVAYSRRLLQEFSPAPLPPEHAMIAAFTHLFASPVGYGAGYYSYKWAEVLEADAFTRFRDGGIFSREIGAAFRGEILSRGDSEDPAELYRRFMGRDPDPPPCCCVPAWRKLVSQAKPPCSAWTGRRYRCQYNPSLSRLFRIICGGSEKTMTQTGSAKVEWNATRSTGRW